MTFSCPFGRYLYIRLWFGVALAGDMFQEKIDEFFSDIPYVLTLLITFKLQGLMQILGIMT